MKRSYMAVFERIAEANWGGWTPDVGGAVSAGESLDAARQSLLEAIGFQLEDLNQRGLESPLACSKAIDFSEFDPDPTHSHYEIEWLTVDLPEAGTRTNAGSAKAA